MKQLIEEFQIQHAIKRIASKINSDHPQPYPIVLICVLNGSFMFFTDLVKRINVNCEIDFVRVKSYQGKNQGEIQIKKDIEIDIEGKDVYIIDDIFDTGVTINSLIEKFKKLNPLSITPVTLVKRKTSPKLDNLIYGFEINNEWIVGYGMDDEEGLNRNLPYIFEIEKT